jgi:hypothetical protein
MSQSPLAYASPWIARALKPFTSQQPKFKVTMRRTKDVVTFIRKLNFAHTESAKYSQKFG